MMEYPIGQYVDSQILKPFKYNFTATQITGSFLCQDHKCTSLVPRLSVGGRGTDCLRKRLKYLSVRTFTFYSKARPKRNNACAMTPTVNREKKAANFREALPL